MSDSTVPQFFEQFSMQPGTTVFVEAVDEQLAATGAAA